jgi:uncharacterized lipoprotein YddW (UPF0748 family)
MPQRASTPPPKQEVRAVWVATAAGLDWPRTQNTREQQEALVTIVQTAKALGLNTLFFQVRARGDAYYRSRYEPWADNLTGTLGRDPGWDPLSFLLDAAHGAGIEVHAWFNVFKVRGPNPVKPTTPLHPTLAFPQWTTEIQGEAWLDPGIPAVRTYSLNVALDLVTSYDIDGILFDFVRYPGQDFPDGETYARYGRGTARDSWRRGNLSLFVKEFYERASALKPMLKVGSAPVGVYDGQAEGLASGSYQEYFQDAPAWIRSGWQDYLAPQVYWNIGSSPGDPDFAKLAREWSSRSGGRQIYMAIAAYKPEVLRELPEEIDSARAAGTSGQAFFRYEHIRAGHVLADRYAYPANIPPMPWKDRVSPGVPLSLTVTEMATNTFLLEWVPPPPAVDGDTARRYNVYRWASTPLPVENPACLIAITPGSQCFWTDTISMPSGFSYSYAVSALDKGNNEGLPSAATSTSAKALLALRKKLEGATSFSTSVSSATGTPSIAAYRLPHPMQVSMGIYRRIAAGRDSLVALLFRREQERGTYLVGMQNIPFEAGQYVLRLQAGTTTLEQAVTVTR